MTETVWELENRINIVLMKARRKVYSSVVTGQIIYIWLLARCADQDAICELVTWSKSGRIITDDEKGDIGVAKYTYQM